MAILRKGTVLNKKLLIFHLENLRRLNGRDRGVSFDSTVGQNNLEYRLKYWATRSHCSLVCLLWTARFACALRCTYSFAHSLARGTLNDWMAIFSAFLGSGPEGGDVL